MPHDVIMPALGMAQDTGLLLAWHKKPGDEVAEGDVLFEVETDKASMEVEAQAAGYLTDVSAEPGSDVPVGQTIALISENPKGNGSNSSAPPPSEPSGNGVAAGSPARDSADIDGKQVIMPALGMAQDTGQIISWAKAAGDAVAADDVLLEVETDKSAMEVPAGFDGYVAAILAEAGENVPVGDVIAVISSEKPDAPVTRSAKSGTLEPAASPASAKSAPTPDAPAPAPNPAPPEKAAPPIASGGKILASPKAKRLAKEQGLDLERLALAGVTQPFHVADLETLKTLPAETAPAAATQAVSRRIVAEVTGTALAEFTGWLSRELGQKVRQETVLAGFAASALRATGQSDAISVQTAVRGLVRSYQDPDLAGFGHAQPSDSDTEPLLIVRDLVGSPLTSIQLGAETVPVLTVSGADNALTITCECPGEALSAEAALALTTEFAERIGDPLRQLL
ncbi:pyruvate dehydrogenase [Roseibium denhamense]|uniref:Pyruvate dehydrogenase E2 component (Dihydrolipoamide acetyltransferase) n=1 Tax=Roseibium denhamense TaxID=76305 RepID=A0ABY1P300_9HYPH|nr:biotin/lipoyl-containing protein [Roseibium denhamense]MTI04952.1 pyruvate dehydrogenase [Roseibium denhamense]SMP23561.1 pyruvate dehydrogenase E2 component (dihydrolipoamide acetyltransferase) [Roseibium denhamense]